jgi:hypothetical protein
MSEQHNSTILAFVKPKPANTKQLASVLNLSESRTSEICRELVKQGKLATQKQGNTFMYALPNGKTTLPAPSQSDAPAPASGNLGAALLETAKEKAVKKRSTSTATKKPKKSKAERMLDTSTKKRKKAKREDDMITVPDVAGKQKPAGKDKRIRSVNGSQARLDSLKNYVKVQGGWSMKWGGKTEGWIFKKGDVKKTRTSAQLAEYDGSNLMRFLSR